ncbi:hypothetical protein [Sporisorium scitamineum]|uniref:Uncharacterized protein n=1 Tax=Sporisorium scitamineum TaxID=49012 RepID=A0A0F7S3K3_9BASI|nr:hypothetical protein [Sporisorium scitamineum]
MEQRVDVIKGRRKLFDALLTNMLSQKLDPKLLRPNTIKWQDGMVQDMVVASKALHLLDGI